MLPVTPCPYHVPLVNVEGASSVSSRIEGAEEHIGLAGTFQVAGMGDACTLADTHAVVLHPPTAPTK